MPLFKSDAEKAAEQAERQRLTDEYEQELAANRAAADQAKAQAELAASPIGQATQAWTDGLTFFEVQLDVGRSTREASWGTTSGAEERSTRHLGTLGEIEAIGWRLEHAGYIFMVTGESTSEKFILSGQQVAVSGKTVGIYLFRRPS
jgi:hypothetical protein